MSDGWGVPAGPPVAVAHDDEGRAYIDVLGDADAQEPAWKPRPAATRLMLAAMLGVGVLFDLTVRSGAIGIGTSLLLIGLGVALVASRAVTNRRAWWLLGGVVSVAPWLSVRASVTTVAIDLLVSLLLLATAAGLGRNGPLLTASPNQWLDRWGNLLVSLFTFVPFVGLGVARQVAGRAGTAHRRAAIGRGLLVAVPLAAVLTGLLASADDSFASLFDGEALGTTAGHVVLTLLGCAWFASLAKAATNRVHEFPASHRRFGTTEGVVVLGTLVVVFAAFAAMRGLRVPAEATATGISDEARAGFFQLLGVAAIAFVTLLVVRTKAAAFTTTLRVLNVLASGLTLSIVAIALHRLDEYRAAYGLTELRLGTTWFSWWLGGVFALLAASSFVRLGLRRWAAIVYIGALGVLGAWNFSNPDGVIARENISRSQPLPGVRATRDFDESYVGGLSDDAVPTIVAHLDEVPAAERENVLRSLCVDRGTPTRGLAWNHAASAAAEARHKVCKD